MQTITLLNSKGGTGKTTLATHLAAGLALMGRRVLLIDTDSQANATIALGLSKAPAFYDLMVRGASWRDSIYRVPDDVFTPEGFPGSTGPLYAVPGNVESRNIPNSIDDETVLARRVRGLDGVVDYVIFDTSPTASLLHSAIHAATDWLLLPTQLEGHSALEGVPETLSRAAAIRERGLQYGLDLCKIMGVVPNLARMNTATHSTVLDELKEIHGDLVWNPVKLRIIIAEAQLSRHLAFAYAPQSDASSELHSIAERALQVLEGTHVQA